MTRITTHTVTLLALFVVAGPALACGGYGADVDLDELLREEHRRLARVVLGSHDAKEREAAIAALRAAGQPGLDAMFERGGWLLNAAKRSAGGSQLGDAIDAVAQQKDAAFSRLFWHTDMDKAKAAAKAAGKPILSLRLLGKLTDEYSCANSRFFRTVLYANPDVANYLRQSYVLHWETVRPVPVVTIDFGDGRKVKRTITGNSVHYVLDSEGRVIDAVPGLYTPSEFLRIVSYAHGFAVHSAKADDANRALALEQLHKTVDNEIAQRFGRALPEQGLAIPVQLKKQIDAVDAAPLAIGKARVEVPILAAMDPAFADKLSRELTADQWEAIGKRSGRVLSPIERAVARQHSDKNPGAKAKPVKPILHANSIALMRKQNPQLAKDAKLLRQTVAKFERSIAIDTARNELMFRRVIHEWMAESNGSAIDVAALNDRVYDELFLTPGSDPNLGLIPEYVYTALPE